MTAQARRPKCAVLDQLADALVAARSIWPGEATSLTPCRGGRVDEMRRLGGGDRHGLVEVDVLAGLDRLQPLLVVQADGRAEGDGLDGVIGQQFFQGLVGVGDAVLLGGRLGAARDGVTDGGESDPVLDVRQARCSSAARMPMLPAPTTPIPEGSGMGKSP